MLELAAGFATLSLFLAWRLYVSSMKRHMMEVMLRAVIEGKVEIRRTEDGFEMEVKSNV